MQVRLCSGHPPCWRSRDRFRLGLPFTCRPWPAEDSLIQSIASPTWTAAAGGSDVPVDCRSRMVPIDQAMKLRWPTA